MKLGIKISIGLFFFTINSTMLLLNGMEGPLHSKREHHNTLQNVFHPTEKTVLEKSPDHTTLYDLLDILVAQNQHSFDTVSPLPEQLPQNTDLAVEPACKKRRIQDTAANSKKKLNTNTPQPSPPLEKITSPTHLQNTEPHIHVLKNKLMKFPLLDQLNLIKEHIPESILYNKEKEWQTNPPCGPCAIFSIPRKSDNTIQSHTDQRGTFIVVTNGRFATIHDLATGQSPFLITSHPYKFIESFFNHSENKLALYSRTEVSVYNTTSGKNIFDIDYTQNRIISCSFSPRDSFFMVAHLYKSNLWNLDTKEKYYSFEYPDNHYWNLTLTPNEQFLYATCNTLNKKHIFNLAHEKQPLNDETQETIALNKKQNRLITLSHKKIKILNPHTNTELYANDELTVRPEWINLCADDTMLAIKGHNARNKKYYLKIINLDTLQEAFNYADTEFRVITYKDLFIITPLAPRGSTILYDARANKKLTSILSDQEDFLDITLSDDGSRILSKSKNQIQVWERATQKTLYCAPNNYFALLTTQLSPHNNFLVVQGLTSPEEKSIDIFNMNTQEKIFSFQSNTSCNQWYSFTPDEKHLYLVQINDTDYQNKLSVWDLKEKNKDH